MVAPRPGPTTGRRGRSATRCPKAGERSGRRAPACRPQARDLERGRRCQPRRGRTVVWATPVTSGQEIVWSPPRTQRPDARARDGCDRVLSGRASALNLADVGEVIVGRGGIAPTPETAGGPTAFRRGSQRLDGGVAVQGLKPLEADLTVGLDSRSRGRRAQLCNSARARRRGRRRPTRPPRRHLATGWKGPGKDPRRHSRTTPGISGLRGPHLVTG
jgi:hypothetical protein